MVSFIELESVHLICGSRPGFVGSGCVTRAALRAGVFSRHTEFPDETYLITSHKKRPINPNTECGHSSFPARKDTGGGGTKTTLCCSGGTCADKHRQESKFNLLALQSPTGLGPTQVLDQETTQVIWVLCSFSPLCSLRWKRHLKWFCACDGVKPALRCSSTWPACWFSCYFHLNFVRD